MWRKPSEQHLPPLTGFDRYAKQAPVSRIVPLWGGVGIGGFADVMWHESRKTDSEEWSAVVRAGKLVAACKRVRPGKHRGPWKVLCDNESFLRAEASMAAYRRMNIELIKLPAKSPDLNPVEKMWGWARKKLRKRDLVDLSAGRRILGKTAYRHRIRTLLNSAAAQRVATKFFKRLHKTAQLVSAAKGAAVKG